MVWLFSLLVSKTKSKLLFGLSIAITTIPLLATKYIGFVVENINSISGFGIEIPQILMPLGILFFTFEAISLLCDIRMRKIEGKVSIFDTFLYLTFFATVTSGPIIRYQNFKDGLKSKIEFENYGLAIEKIIIGLCKKVLIADKIALLADYYFDGVAAGSTYSCLGLWIGSIAYTLQLYYDFSGYSDMAIGI